MTESNVFTNHSIEGILIKYEENKNLFTTIWHIENKYSNYRGEGEIVS